MLDAGRMREGMIEVAHLCEYVVASEEFAKEFLREDKFIDPEKAVINMKSFGARAVTITLGDRGCITAAGEALFYTCVQG